MEAIRGESPIEDIFAWHCMKYLSDEVTFDNQVWVNTEHGRFRIDFVLSEKNQKVAVECDGHDFHDEFRDEFRDAILLGEGHLGTIYHFRGCDLTYYPEDCIWLMSFLDSRLFIERGQLQLNQLHKLEIDHIRSGREDYILKDPTSISSYRFWAFRRSIHNLPGWNLRHGPDWQYWKALYRFACEHPQAGLDELIQLERKGGSHAKT
ncbi:hypothetical protein ES703_121594 [subsurface metagenome]